MITLQRIENDLYERYHGCCLDNAAELSKVAAYVLELLKEANGVRDAGDTWYEQPCIIRAKDKQLVANLPMFFWDFVDGDVEVIALPPRPFR